MTPTPSADIDGAETLGLALKLARAVEAEGEPWAWVLETLAMEADDELSLAEALVRRANRNHAR